MDKERPHKADEQGDSTANAHFFGQKKHRQQGNHQWSRKANGGHIT